MGEQLGMRPEEGKEFDLSGGELWGLPVRGRESRGEARAMV